MIVVRCLMFVVRGKEHGVLKKFTSAGHQTSNNQYGHLKKFKNIFMQKYIFACAIVIAMSSCNDANNNSKTDDTKTNAAANDSTQAPNGVTTGSAISTNTEATKMDSTSPK